MTETATPPVEQGKTILGIPKKPSGILEQRGFCIALVGMGGVGKTSLLPTLRDSERGYPVCLFDLDAGSWVLPDEPDLDVFPLKSLTEVDSKRELLKQFAGTPRLPYSTFVWDVVSVLQQTELKANGLSPVAARTTDTRRLYGASNLYMQQFFTEQKDLAATAGVNIILTFWADDASDSAGNKSYDLNITHGSALAALGLLDLIYYVETDNGKYPPILRVGGSVQHKTKNRVAFDSQLRKLPNIIYQPSLGTLIDAAHGQPFPFDRHTKKRAGAEESK